MRLAVYHGTTWQQKHARGFLKWYANGYIVPSIRSPAAITVINHPTRAQWVRAGNEPKDHGYADPIEEDFETGYRNVRIQLFAPKNLGKYQYMTRLAHECVHAKQFILGELKWTNYGARFNNEKFYQDEDGNMGEYWTIPWEVQAMGFEIGLVRLYSKQADVYSEIFTNKVKSII